MKIVLLFLTLFLAQGIHLESSHDAATHLESSHDALSVDLLAGTVRLKSDEGQYLKVSYNCATTVLLETSPNLLPSVPTKILLTRSGLPRWLGTRWPSKGATESISPGATSAGSPPTLLMQPLSTILPMRLGPFGLPSSMPTENTPSNRIMDCSWPDATSACKEPRSTTSPSSTSLLLTILGTNSKSSTLICPNLARCLLGLNLEDTCLFAKNAHLRSKI